MTLGLACLVFFIGFLVLMENISLSMDNEFTCHELIKLLVHDVKHCQDVFFFQYKIILISYPSYC